MDIELQEHSYFSPLRRKANFLGVFEILSELVTNLRLRVNVVDEKGVDGWRLATVVDELPGRGLVK